MEKSQFITEIEEHIEKRENELTLSLQELRKKQYEVGLRQESLGKLNKLLESENNLVGGHAILKSGNLTYAESAENIMKSFPTEITIPELHDKIIESGFKLKGKNPKNTLRGILNKYPDIFYKTSESKWGLRIWQT